jgi:hypothetical protein
MRRYRLLILVLSSCLLAAPLSAGSHDKDAELINRAVNNMNIFALPTFSMAAKLQIETQGKLLDGDYELLWNGPNQWRETTTFPGYSEIRVGGKGRHTAGDPSFTWKSDPKKQSLRYGTERYGAQRLNAPKSPDRKSTDANSVWIDQRTPSYVRSLWMGRSFQLATRFIPEF